MHQRLPTGGGMCGSSIVLPGNVVYDHSSSQPLLLSLLHACPGGARRWTALWVVGLEKLFHDWAEWFLWLPSASAPLSSSRILPSLIVHCLDLASPEESLFPSRSMRKEDVSLLP